MPTLAMQIGELWKKQIQNGNSEKISKTSHHKDDLATAGTKLNIVMLKGVVHLLHTNNLT